VESSRPTSFMDDSWFLICVSTFCRAYLYKRRVVFHGPWWCPWKLHPNSAVMALIGQEDLEVVSPSANRKQQHQPHFSLLPRPTSFFTVHFPLGISYYRFFIENRKAKGKWADNGFPTRASNSPFISKNPFLERLVLGWSRISLVLSCNLQHTSTSSQNESHDKLKG
jgi:hypothetical protein